MSWIIIEWKLFWKKVEFIRDWSLILFLRINQIQWKLERSLIFFLISSTINDKSFIWKFSLWILKLFCNPFEDHDSQIASPCFKKWSIIKIIKQISYKISK